MEQFEKKQKVENYKELNKSAVKGQILFTGSSLMEQFPICELCQSLQMTKKVYNRGISGTTTEDFLREIDTVLLDLEPSEVFINIGTNDMNRELYGNLWLVKLIENYRTILEALKKKLPDTNVYIMAYYPVNDAYEKADSRLENMLQVRTNANLKIVNEKLKDMAEMFGYLYIDVNKNLTDEEEKLKLEYTIEGIHMNAKGYRIVFENLKEYLQERA